MHLAYTPEQQRLRAELRAYFATLVPDNAYARYAEPAAQKRFYRDTVRRLGADGWLGVGWPKEYGGRGLTPMEQFIFFDEAAQAGVPLPLMALNTVGPTIMRFGTEEQKARFLPGILSGEIDFAIGYSEPEAGTDLAALRTRAVREGDTYVVNGQKIWTTNGDTADWVWLAVRTDPDAPPHKGITMLLVPTGDPGYSCTLINTLASHDTAASHYENIRVRSPTAWARRTRAGASSPTSSTTNASPSPPTARWRSAPCATSSAGRPAPSSPTDAGSSTSAGSAPCSPAPTPASTR